MIIGDTSIVLFPVGGGLLDVTGGGVVGVGTCSPPPPVRPMIAPTMPPISTMITTTHQIQVRPPSVGGGSSTVSGIPIGRFGAGRSALGSAGGRLGASAPRDHGPRTG